MSKRALRQNGSLAGQALTESILMLPLFFVIAFILLQVGQLGMAVVMANYAASSVARAVANEQKVSSSGSAIDLDAFPDYRARAEKLMVAGMSLKFVTGCIQNETDGTPTGNLTVRVTTRVDTLPLLGLTLERLWKDNYADESRGICQGDSPLVSSTAFGPFNFSVAPDYYFYISGIARVRMNYKT